MNLRYTLKKHQILRSKKEISDLFENGKSITEYPLRLVYKLKPITECYEQKTDRFKLLFVVPKKNIKKAVQRNRIRRKIKESFRLQQHQLIIPEGYIYLLAFIYIAKKGEEEEMNRIGESVSKLIKELFSDE